jgi:hypothetical protein
MKSIIILSILTVLLALLLAPSGSLAQYSPLAPPESMNEQLIRCILNGRSQADYDRCHTLYDEQTTCAQPGWWQMPPWMGRYPLWTDGTRYCVEGK